MHEATNTAAMASMAPLVFVPASDGAVIAAVVVPFGDGTCDCAELHRNGRLRRREGAMSEMLAGLAEAGFARDDGFELPRRLREEVRDITGDGPPTPYHHGPTWSAHALKRTRKGAGRAPLPSSEKAWVDTCPDYPTRGPAPKQPYLEFVRYMRWYARRSYLQRKIEDRPYDPEMQPYFSQWPRHVG